MRAPDSDKPSDTRPVSPFGRPRVLTDATVDRLTAAEHRPLLDVLRTLRHERHGLALLQTGDRPSDPGAGGTSATRSILVTRALVRAELVEDRLELEALDPAAAGLVRLLRATLPAGIRTAPVLAADEELRLTGGAAAGPGEAGDPLEALRSLAGLVADRQRVDGLPPPGLFGAFGYEIVDRFESLPPRARDGSEDQGDPDFSFVLAADMVVVDHESGSLDVVTRRLPDEPAADAHARRARVLHLLRDAAAPAADSAGASSGRSTLPDPEFDLDESAFLDGVATIAEHIASGDVFQTVLSREARYRITVDPLRVYEILVARNPSPYAFYLDLGRRGALCGSSPETFLKVDGEGFAELRPIAGTTPRGRHADGTVDPDLDGRLALAMRQDPKEQAEHAMLLDLARNDVARIAEPGTTRVTEAFAVERFRHVQHLVSRVRGRLRGGLDALHAYRATANMGTLTGAPKPRAMRRIRELEASPRGFYGGAAGYVLQDGRMDTAIVIRSLRIRPGLCTVRTGAGIVRDSIPDRELKETRIKARACVEALAAAAAPCAPGATPSPTGADAAAPGHSDPDHRRRSRTPRAADAPPSVLVLDHADSFVFNLVDHLRQLGADVQTLRADAPDALAAVRHRLASDAPDLLLLSPGPGHPDDAAVAAALLGEGPDRHEGPILGVCLGHQAIVRACGGTIERCGHVAHGQVTQARVALPEDPMFRGLPERFTVARYHSLCAPSAALPPTLRAVATSTDAVGPDGRPLVLAVRHARLPWVGLQFHPESYLTPAGSALLANLLDDAVRTARRATTAAPQHA